MKLRFAKMHGLGNDFVVLDALDAAVKLDEPRVRELADRRTGIGFDQLLLLEAPKAGQFHANYRIFNADGGEVEQCGNGVRCVARYLANHGVVKNGVVRLGTIAGPVQAELTADGLVRANMGVPHLEPAEIPFTAAARAMVYELDVDGRSVEIGAVSMGNPHAILDVPDVATAPVTELGPRIEHHPRFPKRANVGFASWQDRKAMRLRVWERGTGETLACGTGACAAVVWGRLLGWLDESVTVELRGGRLVVSWRGEGEPVWMTGPAVTVYEGQVEL
ncbi:MAG TPA: diaminopimelate epimerase [Gammaproteobacteria bacterium]|nr:diaminopimelate epimerase [Gammaproteobacteria bacterium]